MRVLRLMILEFERDVRRIAIYHIPLKQLAACRVGMTEPQNRRLTEKNPGGLVVFVLECRKKWNFFGYFPPNFELSC